MSTPARESQLQKSSPSGWDRHAIVAAVHRQGFSLVALAVENGLSRQACSAALNIPFPAADRAISECIGVPLHELWPTRYDEDGKRIGLIRRATAPKKSPKRKKA